MVEKRGARKNCQLILEGEDQDGLRDGQNDMEVFQRESLFGN